MKLIHYRAGYRRIRFVSIPVMPRQAIQEEERLFFFPLPIVNLPDVEMISRINLTNGGERKELIALIVRALHRARFPLRVDSRDRGSKRHGITTRCSA